MTTFDQVRDAALSLAERERAGLAFESLQSLGDPVADDSLEAEWVTEIQRRSADWHAGRVEGVDAEDLIRRLRDRLQADDQ